MTAFKLFVGRLLHLVCPICSLPAANAKAIPASLDHSAIALCKEGHLNEAVRMLQNIHDIVDSSTYVNLLQCCIQKKALHHGKHIHNLILNRNELRFREDVVLQNTLLQLYVKCGSLVDARGVFDGMIDRNVFSWNLMIAAYRKHGLSDEALALFHKMQRSGSDVLPNEFTFSSVVPACANSASLEECVDIHRKIIRSGFHLNVVVTNVLIGMYAKFGNIQKARELFDEMKDRTTISWNAMIAGYAQNGLLKEAETLFREMQHRNTVSWNVMIAGYAQNGLHEEALEVFEEMQRSDVVPNETTFASVLPACVSSASLEEGVDIHRKITRSGFHSDVVVTNTLIDMYAKFGNIEKARELFEKMKDRTTISWNAMIAVYAQNGFGEEALEVFEAMQRSGAAPNEFTFGSVLTALASLEDGVDIHGKIVKSGFHSNIVVTNVLIDMYAKFGKIQKSRVLFDKMQQRDTISWNAMITGYAQNGHGLEALKVFQKMQLTGFRPDSITFSSVLPACASSASLQEGVDIHGKIVRSGFHLNVVVTNALIDMYGKFGNIQKARVLFDKMQQRNAISWTAMTAGYAQNGFHEEARVLFDKMQQRDTISWTAMITEYAHNGYGLQALKCFQKMQLTGLRPDSITFASILSVCATFAALKWGMDIHGQITRCGFLSHATVITALIDMYSKCGSIKKESVLFDKMHNRQTISWNAMIAGYARNGHSKEAIKLFEQMEYAGISPDDITLVSVLSACNHAGLVEEGYQYFKSMNDYYRITPTMKHYTCMVDLLGRAGCLDEAKDFINSMPIKPDATVWTCLLGACRIHNNQQLAEFVAEHLLQLDSQNSLPYVLLSNIYAISGRWNQIENVRKMMKDRGIRKLPGCSWIVVNTKVHAFFVGDRSHPKTEEIYRELERSSQVMKAVGYVPDTSFVLQDVKEEEKEQILCHHSEELAIAFGLLNMSSGTSIRVVKNLRVCGNCHSATKFLSKIVEREIVVRDATRFHHFKEG